MSSRFFQYRAHPEPGFLHGVAQLDRGRTELQCDALYFPTEDDAEAWAKSRKWEQYVIKRAVGIT